MDYNDALLVLLRKAYAMQLESLMSRTMEGNETFAYVMIAEAGLLHDEVSLAAKSGPQAGSVVGFWSAYGFYVANTGGGCEALMREWGKGHIWITAEDDPSIPDKLADKCTIGWYDEEGRDICSTQVKNSYIALTIVGERR